MVLRKEPIVSVLTSVCRGTEQSPSGKAAGFGQKNSSSWLASTVGRGSAASDSAAVVAGFVTAASGQPVTRVASCSASSAAGFVHWRMAVTPVIS